MGVRYTGFCTLRRDHLYIFDSETNHYTEDVRVRQRCLLILYDRHYSTIGIQPIYTTSATGPSRLILWRKSLVCIIWDDAMAKDCGEDLIRNIITNNRNNTPRSLDLFKSSCN